jgi:hypothetical protein
VSQTYRNYSDSQQLQWLRVRYIDSGQQRPVTPYRLGAYAARTSSKIDDYGSHSTRWRNLFERGFTGFFE